MVFPLGKQQPRLRVPQQAADSRSQTTQRDETSARNGPDRGERWHRFHPFAAHQRHRLFRISGPRRESYSIEFRYPGPKITLTLPLWHAYTVVLGSTSVTGGRLAGQVRCRTACTRGTVLPRLGAALRWATPESSRCRLTVRSMDPDTTAQSLVHGRNWTPKMFASC